jgi:UDP-N-acetyl-D-mannosaminuronic acid dehydrogenase
MAFKADIDDIRDSLSYKLRKILIFNGANVICYDDFVSDPEFVSQKELIENSDIIIIGTPHSTFNKISFKDKFVINIWSQ